MGPRANRHRTRDLQRTRGGRAPFARAAYRHDHERELRVALGQQRLLAFEIRARVGLGGHAPELERGGPREELILLDRRLESGVDHVLADGAKQEDAAHQEEHDDEQRRDEADEDVAEDQLPPDAPQQPAPGQTDETGGEIRDADQQRERPGRADDLDDEVVLDDAKDQRRERS